MPFQKCPKCDGQGTVSKPPYIAGDVFEWSSSSGLYQCDVGGKSNPFEVIKVITKRENSSKDRKGISKYTGVTFNKKTNKWCSQIWINGQNKTLGSFDDELEAHRAYQKASQQHLKSQ